MTKEQMWAEYEKLRQIKICANVAEQRAIVREDLEGVRLARELFDETAGRMGKLIADWYCNRIP